MSRVTVSVLIAAVIPVLIGGARVVAAFADSDQHAGHEAVLASEPLANIPGQQLTAVIVRYPPGGASPRHHHAGSVFAYVISGAIRSENSATGPARVYSAGESFFEPAGSEHTVSANASATEPAALLAVFVAERGAQLTTMDH